jgi:hypothetical protein
MMNPPPAFAGLEDLLGLGHGDGIDMRPTLLRVLTDLYLQRPTHSLDDERYYTELALRLIDAVDTQQRAALAARLAPYPSAPRPVILQLAYDEIEVAADVLEHSPCLTAADLSSITGHCGSAHAAIIARRNVATASETAPPADIPPGKAAAAELSELFYAAGAAERRLILLNLDYATVAPAEPAAAIQRTDIWRLESAALQHNGEAVVRELERALALSRAQARRIVNDELGDPIVVAAKAMNLPSDMVQRMLLFMNPRVGQSVDRIYELTELYSEISIDAARRLIAIWRDADTTPSIPVQHEPVAWRTAAENARRALSEVTRRPELRQETRLRSRIGER